MHDHALTSMNNNKNNNIININVNNNNNNSKNVNKSSMTASCETYIEIKDVDFEATGAVTTATDVAQLTSNSSKNSNETNIDSFRFLQTVLNHPSSHSFNNTSKNNDKNNNSSDSNNNTSQNSHSNNSNSNSNNNNYNSNKRSFYSQAYYSHNRLNQVNSYNSKLNNTANQSANFSQSNHQGHQINANSLNNNNARNFKYSQSRNYNSQTGSFTNNINSSYLKSSNGQHNSQNNAQHKNSHDNSQHAENKIENLKQINGHSNTNSQSKVENIEAISARNTCHLNNNNNNNNNSNTNNTSNSNINNNFNTNNHNNRQSKFNRDRRPTQMKDFNYTNANNANKMPRTSLGSMTMPAFNINYKNQFQPPPFNPPTYHHEQLNHHNAKKEPTKYFNNNTNANNYSHSHQQHHQSHLHHNHHNHIFHHHHQHNHQRNHQHSHQHNNEHNLQHSQHLHGNQSQKNKILIDKYNRKYNLISFILLRKNDEYLSNNKFYMNDQFNYEKIDQLIEKFDLDSLMNFYKNSQNAHNAINIVCHQDTDEQMHCANELQPQHNQQQPAVQSSTKSVHIRLANYVNSYNCSLFVHTIRKLLEQANEKSRGMSKHELNKVFELLEFLFSDNIRPDTFYLVDGDYPRRNLLHYAARYDCPLIVELVRKSLQQQLCASNLELDASGVGLSRVDFVMAQLCLQPDFHGNTPIHLASQNNSLDVIRLVHATCLKNSLFMFNEDGLNSFLLMCRHSSVQFIKYFLDSCDVHPSLVLASSIDRMHLKNCIHYACGRGCGTSCLSVVDYLVKAASRMHSNCNNQLIDAAQKAQNATQHAHASVLNELLTGVSPLVASVYHVAASNLTRLVTLWRLLNLSDALNSQSDRANRDTNLNWAILNKLDFREFTVIDCLFDSLINLREMAPSTCRLLANYYQELLNREKQCPVDVDLDVDVKTRVRVDLAQDQNQQQQQEQGQAKAQAQELTESKHQRLMINDFSRLLFSCVYKLLNECGSSINNIPRIKNTLELIEFTKLLVFMSKFQNEINYSSSTKESANVEFNLDSSKCELDSNFEYFTIHLLNKFLFNEETVNFKKFNFTSANPTSDKSSNISTSTANSTLLSFTSMNGYFSNTTTTSTTSSTSNTSSSSTTNPSSSSVATAPTPTFNKSQADVAQLINELESLFELLENLYQLSFNVLCMNKYSQNFELKLVDLVKSYFNKLSACFGLNNATYDNYVNYAVSYSASASGSSVLDTDDECIFSSSSSVCSSSCGVSYATTSASTAATAASTRSAISAESFVNLSEKLNNLTANKTAPAMQPHSNNNYLLVDYNQYKAKMIEFKQKIDKLENMRRNARSLKDLARLTINSLIIKRAKSQSTYKSPNGNDAKCLSALSRDHFVYFQLPKNYFKFINFLTFNLIDDLYGKNFD